MGKPRPMLAMAMMTAAGGAVVGQWWDCCISSLDEVIYGDDGIQKAQSPSTK